MPAKKATTPSYEALSPAEQVVIARDLLRARESDHFRLSLLDEPGKEERLAALEADIENIKATLGSLEKQAS